MDNFKKSIIQPPNFEASLTPKPTLGTRLPRVKQNLGRTKPAGGETGSRADTRLRSALPPSTRRSPLPSGFCQSTTIFNSRTQNRSAGVQQEHADRVAPAAVQPDVGPRSRARRPGVPGDARGRLDRKQRRRGKSKRSSSELFNTSLYCLCF